MAVLAMLLMVWLVASVVVSALLAFVISAGRRGAGQLERTEECSSSPVGSGGLSAATA